MAVFEGPSDKEVEEIVLRVGFEFFVVEGGEHHWVQHLVVTLIVYVAPLHSQLIVLTFA